MILKKVERDDLLPCPFCGRYPYLEISEGLDDAKDYQITCQCFVRTWYEETEDEVIRLWNTRMVEY